MDIQFDSNAIKNLNSICTCDLVQGIDQNDFDEMDKNQEDSSSLSRDTMSLQFTKSTTTKMPKANAKQQYGFEEDLLKEDQFIAMADSMSPTPLKKKGISFNDADNFNALKRASTVGGKLKQCQVVGQKNAESIVRSSN